MWSVGDEKNTAEEDVLLSSSKHRPQSWIVGGCCLRLRTEQLTH